MQYRSGKISKLRFLYSVVAILLASVSCGAYATENLMRPVDVLAKQNSDLHRLYLKYSSMHEALGAYAIHQGFSLPFEHLGTIIHELIHIDSAVHTGFLVDGVYYEPYLKNKVWTDLNNRSVLPHLTDFETGVMSSVYMSTTPQNNLGNVLDEMNAYSQVIVFICSNEPASRNRQSINLLGLLRIQEAYLRTARVQHRGQYIAMARNRETSGAIRLISERSWRALSNCGVGNNMYFRNEVDSFLWLSERLV